MVIFCDNLETVEQMAHCLKALNTRTSLVQRSTDCQPFYSGYLFTCYYLYSQPAPNPWLHTIAVSRVMVAL